MHNKIKKKYFTFLLCFILGMACIFPVMQINAKESIKVIDDVTWDATGESSHENYNVSSVPPIAEPEITPFGIDPPARSNVQNLNSGKLTFSGYADRSTLYTNKNFTGKSRVTVSVTNWHEKELTVKVICKDDILKFPVYTTKVPANAGRSVTVTGLDSNKLYYLSFSAPSDFEGYVK